jgi:general stress protein 26
VFAWPVVGPWYWQTFQVPKMAEGQRGDFVDPDQFPDWVERYRPQIELRGFGQALHSTVRALAAVDFDSVYAEYGRQGIRTLLIWGTEDATVPISRRASVQAGIPSLTYVPIASAGHLPHLERADTVNTVLLNFLRPGLADSAARASALEVARSVMATARYATLVTVGPGGHPQARVMDPFAPDSAFVVRLATNARSRKAAEIARDPRVTLLYLDAAGQSYVTVIGRAELVRDLEERRRWWKPEWAAFYTGGNLGDDYLLIRVRPERLELSSERHGLLNDAVTWRPVIVELP